MSISQKKLLTASIVVIMLNVGGFVYELFLERSMLQTSLQTNWSDSTLVTPKSSDIKTTNPVSGKPLVSIRGTAQSEIGSPSPLQNVNKSASTTLETLTADQVDWMPSHGFAATTAITEANGFDGYYTTKYDIKTIGIIKAGRYKDKELLRVDTSVTGDDGPCKGLTCGKRYPGARFIKDGSTLVLLPRISGPPWARHDYDNNNPFNKIGLSIITDPNFSISVLGFPSAISGQNPRQLLRADSGEEQEEFGSINTAKLEKVFSEKTIGDVYTTKVEVSHRGSFYYDADALSDIGADSCDGAFCFLTNGFYVFRPDGTFLKFSYAPDLSVGEISWSTGTTSSEYDYATRYGGCTHGVLDYNSVIDPVVVHGGNDFVVAGTDHFGAAVYVLKDKDHPLLHEFYENYKKYFYDWRAHSDPEDVQNLSTYDEFLASRPIFFWHDPFGRIIRFQNEQFLPAGACEPIIYLYPVTTQKVSVSVHPRGGVMNSTPLYGKNGWEVVVDPDGKIYTPSQKTYPYLFWEGWSLIFPMREKGFVVSQLEVHEFLVNTLYRFGLNDNEINDFVRAWEPRFVGSPYYFITFYDRAFIDDFAPLTVSPKPDTIIRVLMDYRPLDKPIKVEPIQIHTPQRRGFTVVEWGGLVR